MAEKSLPLPDREGPRGLRRRAVLTEAGRQFARHGFRATTLDGIAKNLGLTKAGLYHYVVTKEQLLFDCYLDSLDVAERCMVRAGQDGKTGLDKLCRYIRGLFASFDRPDGFFVLLNEVPALSDEHQRQLRRKGRVVDQGLRSFIQQGIDDGSIRACDAAVVELAIQGALNWLPKWYSSSGRKDVGQIIEEFIDFFSHGLKPR
jgi:TetR/AcrR family transcriptional regulator